MLDRTPRLNEKTLNRPWEDIPLRVRHVTCDARKYESTNRSSVIVLILTSSIFPIFRIASKVE